MATADVDVIVVGAGVVGLASALALARAGREVFVLEANERAGEGISSRNSGVVHAGMYYPTGSRKARCCVRGLQLLYRFCEAHRVPYRRTGKLIVATEPDERPALEALHARAAANGVRTYWLEREQALALEPALRCVAAIDSPDSGIVEVPELVNALIGRLEAHGGQLVVHSEVRSVRCADGTLVVQTVDGGETRCNAVVNAAGLGAVPLAQAIEPLAAHHVPKLYYGAGHYYNSRAKVPFSRLIYPLPHHTGLGVHLGMDIAGRKRFGPDVRYQEKPDYRFDDSRRGPFADAIREWWPDLRDEDLTPDFVGVRPKLAGPHEPSHDFGVQGPAVHGVPGLVNLFGIESPGLTSCLALAEEVASEL
jgi:L-2-hydroxyglutarate oxidase LhgO